MSKKYVIPISKCKSLKPSVINNNVFKNVKYNNISVSSQMQDVIDISIRRWNIDEDENGNKNYEELPNIESNYNYELRTVTSNSMARENIPYIFDYYVIKIDITEYQDYVPIFVGNDATIEVIVERQQYIKLEDNTTTINNPKIKLEYDNNINYDIESGDYHDGWNFIVENDKEFIVLYLYNKKYVGLFDDEDRFVFIVRNHDININLKKVVETTNEVSLNEQSNPFDMITNSFMNDTAKYMSLIPISSYNAQKILNNYKNGKLTFESQIVSCNLFDENGNLVIDKDKGEIPQVGDEISFSGIKDKSYVKNKKFILTSVEFGYNGVPKIIIKGKEV